jgi:hypothetical protein
LPEFVQAGPRPQRAALRALLAVARRPRGPDLLGRLPALDQTAASLLALGRYDEPARARTLGWDADGVVARGRAVRRAEGRP